MKSPALFIALLVGITAVIHGCASSTAPDWVSGNSQKYKSSEYLLGVGQAQNSRTAKDRARAELAKIFEVSIEVDTKDIQTHKKTVIDDNASSVNESAVARTIVTRTNQIIQGIEIADLWIDLKSENYYALAVLPRLKTANSLRQDIERLDAATETYTHKARSSNDLIIKIGAASRALDAQIERSAYQKSLKVIDRSGRGIEPKWSTDRLRADLDDLFKRVRIGVRIDEDSHKELKSILAGGLSAAGFLVEPGQTPDYILEGAIRLQEIVLQDGWYWARGTLEIKFYETVGERIRGTRHWNIKVSARHRGEVRRRAIGQIESIIKKELRGTIVQFSTS